ncbi:unnamed protein product [Calicophoron daubneyi]|uniref:XPG N-terminal domain-containing protein n=1 Tax=Calicophoron daubneyi TaxID=300641 RepID=A0AAV2TS29_CALDB
MGVRGLSSYISGNAGNFKEYELHNSLLVIDAENYINYCYRSSPLLRHYGGEYMDFTVYVRIFLKLLGKCRITPIFVFDGCHDKEGTKLDTLLRRNMDRIQDLKRFLLHAQAPLDPDTISDVPDILPKLTNTVFVEILRECNIYHVACEREADVHIAELAALLDCPLLSNDSDFYIFRPPNPENYRYIPLNSLSSQCKRAGTRCPSCVAASMDCFSLSCSVFVPGGPSLKRVCPSLLPLLAVLVGNDFMSAIRLPASVQTILNRRSTSGLSFNARRIDALIEWLGGFGDDTTTPLREVLSSYAEEDLKTITNQLTHGVSGYTVNPEDEGLDLAKFLNLKYPISMPHPEPCSPQTSLEVGSGKISGLLEATRSIQRILPQFGESYRRVSPKYVGDGIHCRWPTLLVRQYRNMSCSTALLDCLYVHSGSVLRILFEDLRLPQSVYVVNEHLRQVQYNLLLKLEASLNNTSKLCGLEGSAVVEHKRDCDKMRKFLVPVSPLTFPLNALPSTAFCEMFSHEMHLNLRSDIKPVELQGLIATLILWIRHSQFATNSGSCLNTSPVGLAFTACALVNCARLVPVSKDSTSLERRSAELCEYYITCANAAKSDCFQFTNDGRLSIELVHQLNELQLVFLELKHFVALLDALLVHYTQSTVSSSNIPAPSTQYLAFWPSWFVFPSGRLLYWLSKLFSVIHPSERMNCMVNLWIPRLFCMSDSREQRRLETILHQFQWLVRVVDAQVAYT